MAATRPRLTDAQVAALARFRFGLAPEPELPPAADYENAQGVPVATREGAELTVLELPRWESPAAVGARLQADGWRVVEAWVGAPPDDIAELPDELLVLLPAAGLPPDSARLSAAAAEWAGVRAAGLDVVVVPVPVTAHDPELGPGPLARAYGATLIGARLTTGAAQTGGTVVFCTGLPGAGKSTIAARLVQQLVEEGRTVTLLDGDEVRQHLSAGLGFGKEDRDTNVRRIGWVAAQIAKHGGIAVCAPIAPYAEVRDEVRRDVEEQAGEGSFVLVHVATPLEECEARDRKGLYARARSGELPAFTGISDPYEVPVDAEVTVQTSGRSVEECARQVLGAIRRR